MPGLYSILMKQDKTATIPLGWFSAGSNPDDYEFILDKKVFHSGKASGLIQAKQKDPKGFGTLMQDFSAEQYKGKRMQLSAYIRTENVENWAGMWMRVEGAGQDSLGFDNMKNRQLKGTIDWKAYSIVLDVPQDSKLIGFGILLSGAGKIWIDDVSFEEVKKDVAVTNMEKPLPAKPSNLDFEE